ncbi:transposon Tf2-1 polyprotein isoform X1 [Cucumis melo var. makuwa]|uniref:Transposon Tf2-1 polyprotein isoform X1 n=1 Tax=Cucumis melo var. makuwa TaxID=1194695 RepID=A0A5D3DXI4_CUCMM|nr:transposon Tf2-1 polyprotein isoform X1 [Cucumis melo var. makuwa]TYK28222.1 transposon Tf2-1 polyprotein isoform X1 [Cucumis melo var. makuwa]
MLMTMIEYSAKERSVVSERVTKSAARDSATRKGKENEATLSMTAKSDRNIEVIRDEKKNDSEENSGDRNEFKKVEMPVFIGEDPDSWLFRIERYFQIHKLNESEKMLVSTISFDGPALNWYRLQEERDKYLSWINLKERLLVCFRSSRDGIKQESTVEEYRNLFDKLVAPLSNLQERVIEDTFMNGLLPWIRAKVAFCRSKGLAEMMQVAWKTERSFEENRICFDFLEGNILFKMVRLV